MNDTKEDNLLLLEQHITELTKSERDDLDKTITELANAPEFYDLFLLENPPDKPAALFRDYILFDIHYLKWVFSSYAIKKLWVLNIINHLDKIKRLLNLDYPEEYIPSFIYSWFERHFEEWRQIVDRIRTKYPDISEEVNIKEFSEILTAVLNGHDAFQNEDHFIKIAAKKINNALPNPFLLNQAYLYTRWAVFSKKTDKYKERLKEFTKSPNEIDKILNKIPRGKRKLNNFYDAVNEFLPERERICAHRLGEDLLKNQTIAIKVLQKLYPNEGCEEYVSVKIKDAPYVLYEISPQQAGEKYLARINCIMDRTTKRETLFEVDELVKLAKDVIDSSIAKGHLKSWTGSDEPPKILLKDLGIAIQRWNKENPDHQVPLPDWVTPKTAKKPNQIEKSESQLDHIKNQRMDSLSGADSSRERLERRL